MNDQDRQLLQSILQSAGEAGEKGFGYLVHWTVVDAITGLFATFGEAAFVCFLAYKLYAWKPEKSYDDDFKHLARGAGLLICSVVIFICIGCVFENITALITPEGAAIHHLAQRVK